MTYNPLDKANLAASIERAILELAPQPLPPSNTFPGAGLYVIYYSGDFGLYAPLSAKNANGHFRVPIYVGKAVSRGTRSHLVNFDSTITEPVLFRRLQDHAASIQLADNLAIDDFVCRWVLLDEVWIPLGEALMIQHFRPLWNSTVTGFGNHDPGSRRPQLMSKWDTLHPGRTAGWSARLIPGPSIESIRAEVTSFFASEEFTNL